MEKTLLSWGFNSQDQVFITTDDITATVCGDNVPENNYHLAHPITLSEKEEEKYAVLNLTMRDISEASPYNKAFEMLTYPDRVVSPECLDSLNMIRDDVCSRRSERWLSTPAWRALCFIYVGGETGVHGLNVNMAQSSGD